jgi:hypothetical protein
MLHHWFVQELRLAHLLSQAHLLAHSVVLVLQGLVNVWLAQKLVVLLVEL